jgi:hypothetical protein
MCNRVVVARREEEGTTKARACNNVVVVKYVTNGFLQETNILFFRSLSQCEEQAECKEKNQ